MAQDYPKHIVFNNRLLKSTKRNSKKSVRKFFITHPSPDSLSALKDYFLSTGLKCTGVKLPHEKLNDLESPFVAQLIEPQEFVLVERVDSSNYKVIDSNKRVILYDQKTFLSKWSGMSLIFDFNTPIQPTTQWQKNESSLFRLIGKYSFYLICILMLFPIYYGIKTGDALFLVYISTSIIALYLSYVLVKYEFGKESRFEGSICNSNRIINCKTVLNSKISHPFGLFSLAELSFFFFVFINLSIFNFSLSNVDIFSISIRIGLIYLIISPICLLLILYQGFILKKMCPYCTLINLFILACSLLSFYNLYNYNISYVFTDSYIYLSSLVFAFISTSAMVSYFDNQKTDENITNLFLNLKKNHLVVDALLSQNPSIQFKKDEIILHARKGDSTVLFAINLNCTHCYSAFLEFKHIYATCPKLGIGITFIVHNYNTEEVGGFINKVMESYNRNDLVWLEMIDNWFSNAKSRKANSFLPYDKEVLTTFVNWSKANNISVSPTFIVNDKFWPLELSITDFSNYLRIKYS